jgi:hypothetical protein
MASSNRADWLQQQLFGYLNALWHIRLLAVNYPG